MDQDTFMEVLFFWILYETFAVTHRERKANITRDREAAFARIIDDGFKHWARTPNPVEPVASHSERLK